MKLTPNATVQGKGIGLGQFRMEGIGTTWGKIANRRTWYHEAPDRDGPACDELAITGPLPAEGKFGPAAETDSVSLDRRH
jgi:hypothetical protein